MCLKNIVEHSNDRQIRHIVYSLRKKPIEVAIDSEVLVSAFPNYDPRKMLELFRMCRRQRIDIIQAHLHKPAILALVAAFFCKAKIIVHEHGPIFSVGIQFSLYRLLLRLFRRKADLFIAVSNATSQRLVKKAHIDPDKITVLYNPIDPDRFDPDHTLREKMRKHLQIATDDIVLGFVGRLHHVKGADILIDAMALLLKKSPHYLLLILGDGPQRHSLEAQAKRLAIHHRVRFLGFQENVPQLIGAFDIAVVPSRQEAFGLVAVEFMQAKIPLVSSAVEGLKEIVTHDETAWVTTQNTPAQISQGVEKLRQNLTLRNRLAESAWKFSRMFSIDSYVDRIEKLYHQMTNSNSNG
ncbi:MAG: glycosyltransferase family 4 protein [Planctomycetes bacterium]|nr:glycosyltransferase family 4 protein [Planctomycetota bacterium]